jgi:hypothetical protein
MPEPLARRSFSKGGLATAGHSNTPLSALQSKSMHYFSNSRLNEPNGTRLKT